MCMHEGLTVMVALRITLLLSAVVFLSCSVVAYCQEYDHTYRELYVKSTSTQHCPQHHQCHTLLSYLQDGTNSFTSNTTLHFLPGNHSAAVPQPMTLVISNISNLALRGPEVGPDEPPVAHIWCNYTMQFQFINASNVSLKGLEIQQCGIPILPNTIANNCTIFLLDMPCAVKFMSVDFIAVENVHIMFSHGFGLLVQNSFGNVTIYNSILYYNGRKNFGTDYGIGGNALFYYDVNSQSMKQTDIQVTSSTFGYVYAGNDSCIEWNFELSSIETMPGGLSIVVASQAGLSDIVITISNSSFHNNQAIRGANMMISVKYNPQFSHVYLSILNSSFINGTALEYGGGLYLDSLYSTTISDSIVLGNVAHNGGGLYVNPRNGDIVFINGSLLSENLANRDGGGLYASPHDDGKSTVINISNTIFSRNLAGHSGGGAYIACTEIIIISNSIFSHNEAKNGGSGMYVTAVSGFLFFNCWIKKITFYSNYGSAAIVSHKVDRCLIDETEFIDNFEGSVIADSSHILLQGSVEFSGNRAYAGAAILLDCYDSYPSSFLTFLPNTTVTITNNTALYYGGGIAVDPECNYYRDHCFLGLPSLVINDNYSVAYFDNNKAGIVGHSIYGPSVSQCKLMDGVLGEEVILSTLFSIEGGFFSDQVILAQIYSICFCEVILHTELTCNKNLDKYVFPGEEFSVTALVTGKLDPSHGYVRANITTFGDSGGQLGSSKLQEIQELGRSCAFQLTYSVMTIAKTAVIDLQAADVPNAPHSFININILQCPIGFTFNHSQKKCDCNEYLRSKLSQITCDITRGAIDVPGYVWIGNLSNNRLGVHQHCPLDYCNPVPHSIHLSKQHQQCTSNRSGVLCGACNSGFSLALGTARCLKNCSTYSLFLIIPFALAGVAITCMLLKCNLTVSIGTTNALIFYGNIIHTNRTTFFPQSNVSSITRFLAVFIAWLNLDLGIETCLYRGMTAYVNTWLQFVFPVYIWLLVLIMIYSSRYSVTASKLIGRNAVSVLATLFLLSYAKLLHTTIAVVSPISIEDEDRRGHLLWLMDGNVPYFSAPHAVLFIIALLAVLLYIVPLTLLTLLAPYLQARTNHRVMRWVTRIKPLLDAYQGPYNDKYRYWTGVMFLQRIVLFTVFATNTVGSPNINLFAICVSITIAYIYQIFRGRLYKKRLIWFLEGFYSFNLYIYSLAIFFLKGSQRSIEYLACVMVGSVFIVFFLTVIWHIDYQTTVISRAVKKIQDHLGNQRRQQTTRPQEDTGHPPPSRQPQPTVSVIDMRELREPLLTNN